MPPRPLGAPPRPARYGAGPPAASRGRGAAPPGGRARIGRQGGGTSGSGAAAATMIGDLLLCGYRPAVQAGGGWRGAGRADALSPPAGRC